MRSGGGRRDAVKEKTMSTAARWAALAAIVALAGLCTGCGSDSAALQHSYDEGYAAGLAAGTQPEMSEDCQSCYGLGFSEGYEQGYTDGAASRRVP